MTAGVMLHGVCLGFRVCCCNSLSLLLVVAAAVEVVSKLQNDLCIVLSGKVPVSPRRHGPQGPNPVVGARK